MKPGLPLLLLSIALVMMTVSSGCTQPGASPPPVTPAITGTVNVTTNETLVAFVQEAVAYAREHGREAALREFNDRNGSFVRGELYIYAYDNNSTTLAHPVSPELVGISRLDEPDAFGNPYAWKFYHALANGSGFLWFYYHNPQQADAIERKLGYVARVDDSWWLGSGVYYGPVEPALAALSAPPSTTQEIKAFVESAADYARLRGRENALATFNNRSGPFSQNDLYIYALDYDGRALALPFQPDLVGTSFADTRDASGRYYTRTEIQLARKGGGYLLYQYPDPAANYTVRYKLSYVSPVDRTYWIGAGIYTGEDRLVDPGLRQFLDEARSFALAKGREKALAAFNDRNGSFIKNDLYIFAYDYNGTVLAWPYRPDTIGMNRRNDTDPMGQHHIQAMIDAAKKGGGLVDYYSVNPATNRTELKISYLEDIDGTWFIGSGRYIEPGSVVLRD